jgi:hypothetical protein
LTDGHKKVSFAEILTAKPRRPQNGLARNADSAEAPLIVLMPATLIYTAVSAKVNPISVISVRYSLAASR